MAEKQEIKLDLKDKEILYQLDSNARQSNSQIAKKLRLNKNVVNYRISRLENLGIIRSYSTIIDFSKLGFFLFRVYIDFYEFNINKENELIEYLNKEDLVSDLIRTVGDWDIIANFYVEKINNFQKSFTNFLNKFRSIIKNYDVEIVVNEKILSRDYLLDKKSLNRDILSIGGSSADKLDKKDLEILSLMMKNARIPVIDMTSKLKITSMAIIHRIKQLIKKGVILGFKADINLSKINYSRYRIEFELNDTSIINSFVSHCQNDKNIVSVTNAVGNNFDFRCDLEIDNFKIFADFINSLKNRFQDKIRDYKYVRFIDYYKQNRIPLL